MSKYETLKKETIELALESIDKNITWLAAEMGLHYGTVWRKIKEECNWTRAEVDLLVRVLGDAVIEKVRQETKQPCKTTNQTT